MKIDINKKYRTRDGREAIVHLLTGPRIGFPVIASIQDTDANGGWITSDFTQDGRYLESVKDTCRNDLIQVREPREGFVAVVTEATFERAYGLGDPVGTFVTHRPGDKEDGFEVIRVREIID